MESKAREQIEKSIRRLLKDINRMEDRGRAAQLHSMVLNIQKDIDVGEISTTGGVRERLARILETMTPTHDGPSA